MEEQNARGAAASREREGENSMGSPPRLCYSVLPNQRPEPTGVMTPPPQAPGRVPFRWEEEPGKPRNSSNTSGAKSTARGLELPPRLAVLSTSSSSSSTWQVAKVADAEVPSKTVLEGTYYVLLGPPASQIDDMPRKRRGGHLSCSSFTFGDRSGRFYGREGRRRKKRSGAWFWKSAAPKRGSDEDSSAQKADEAVTCVHRPCSSHSFRSFADQRVEDVDIAASPTKATITRHTRSRSIPRLSTATSHLWGSIYSGLKQAVGVPWAYRRKPTTKPWQRDPPLSQAPEGKQNEDK